MFQNKITKIISVFFACTIFLVGCNEKKEEKEPQQINESSNTEEQREPGDNNSDDNIDENDKDEIGSLVVGTSSDYFPFEFKKDGNIVGFDIDLINAIAAKLKMQVVIKNMSFNSIIPSLETGDIRVGIASISQTQEREKLVDFSIPYYSNSFALLISQDADKDDPIKKGMSIGVETGTLMHQWILKQDLEIKVVSMDSNDELFIALKDKKIDGLLLDNSTAKYLLKSDSAFSNMTVIQLKGVSDSNIAIAVRKDDPILERINAAISELESSGFLRKLKDEWGL
jgi:ABC-type amino acid transport substrate-binding protein